ncbi:MAG: ketosteroid isomerase family protein [Drouetiella hepatica Uher 2000/2452]|jgi:hypothetical protein|uniref:Ketosteroid isomerase family protein n=1 Tax=Drouetiella hepatica Uher 2000/2452 TaxID=904376 RepID=A0A951QF61_9CYAN|nr:ketosteroid isomerase family protein [Drouetiella hepatica Uher 2000/2452]
MNSSTDLSTASENAIAGVLSPTILRYFETLNAEAFQLTARLFAETGKLYPPFEGAIVGQEAIAAYLEKEARGMKVLPREGVLQTAEAGTTEIKVMGKVQTALFSINVSWHFKLDAQAKILTAQVKLLAALEELLSLQK